MKKLFYASLIATLFVAGCGSSGGTTYQAKPKKAISPAKVAAGEEMSLFPLAVGNQWTYEGDSTAMIQGKQVNTPIRFILRVKEVTPIENGVDAVIEQVKQDVVIGTQGWRVTKDGVYQTSLNSLKFEPAQPAIVFPAEDGKEFDWKGSGPTHMEKIGQLLMKSKIIGPEEIDTNMGRMSGIHVESQAVVDTNKALIDSISWWTPKIGLVRIRQQVRTSDGQTQVSTFILSSYTVK